MSAINIDELERAARAATPGPWHPLMYGMQADVRATRTNGSTWVAECRAKDDAAYIAAVSPDVALRLLAVARAAKAMLREDDSTVATPGWRALRAALDELELPL